MFSRVAAFFVLAWSIGFSAASITIIAPSASYWWVANSQNLYSWTCGANYNGGYTNFTVLVNNQNAATFAGPLALVAIQWDYDCSVLLPPVSSLPAASGYVLSFADVYNQSHIIASSDPFEVKPFGSAYAPQPSGVASATVTASESGSATGASAPSATKKSGASYNTHIAAGAISGVVALVGAALLF